MRPHWKKHQRRPAAGGHEAIIEGVIQHHGRFAFLLAEQDGAADAFLRGRGLELAMDGDRVQARVRREANGRFCGEIIRVVKHANSVMAGTLRQSRAGWLLMPENKELPAAQVLAFAKGISPKENDMAVLEVTRWPTPTAGAAGTITEILGAPDSVPVRITMLLRTLGINDRFPANTLAEAKACPCELSPKDWQGREELFNIPVMTIDGADAKDFDDAISLEPLEGGKVRLGVHIADVSHYVRPGSPLDTEAYSRATSVYLPDRVIPMLPHELSDNLCSLMPDVPRLTQSVFLDVDHAGKILKRRLALTVIRSCRRFTYDEAQAVLEGKDVPNVPPAAMEALLRMGKLAETIYDIRMKRGAMDFNLVEYGVKTDESGKPVGVVIRPRLQSHRLIEEFMLMANEAVAAELCAKNLPFLHRRHDYPAPEKLEELAQTLGALGVPAGSLLGGNPRKALQAIIHSVEGKPISGIVNSLAVRSMKQACYSPESQGHFGVAAKYYTHFTSPIRRYPDLMAHRAVAALLAEEKLKMQHSKLAEAGEHCSERERSAAQAEHGAIDILRAEMFKGMVGKEVSGLVVSSTDIGSFVMLEDTGAEGLLRGADLKPGTRVRVTITAVDTASGKIDLSRPDNAPIPPNWRFGKLKKKHR